MPFLVVAFNTLPGPLALALQEQVDRPIKTKVGYRLRVFSAQGQEVRVDFCADFIVLAQGQTLKSIPYPDEVEKNGDTLITRGIEQFDMGMANQKTVFEQRLLRGIVKLARAIKSFQQSLAPSMRESQLNDPSVWEPPATRVPQATHSESGLVEILAVVAEVERYCLGPRDSINANTAKYRDCRMRLTCNGLIMFPKNKPLAVWTCTTASFVGNAWVTTHNIPCSDYIVFSAAKFILGVMQKNMT